jgi:fructokinase
MPAGLFLGGAPYNVAYHLRQLGLPAALVSRVGDDRLGREAVRRVEASGLPTDRIQMDDALPTGFVQVEVDGAGVPTYDIVRPAAWDAIALPEAVGDAAAVVFGSLAQRSDTSRATIQTLLESAALAVVDVNLRPPFVDRAVVQISLERADIVKLSDEELAEIGGWFGLPEVPGDAMAALAERFGCRAVCVTRGADGAALWHEGRWTEHPGRPVEVADTVGAGDAFLAGLLAAMLGGATDEEALDRAIHLGSFVAARPGATPAHSTDLLP